MRLRQIHAGCPIRCTPTLEVLSTLMLVESDCAHAANSCRLSNTLYPDAGILNHTFASWKMTSGTYWNVQAVQDAVSQREKRDVLWELRARGFDYDVLGGAQPRHCWGMDTRVEGVFFCVIDLHALKRVYTRIFATTYIRNCATAEAWAREWKVCFSVW